jgi:Major tropism determinant N-terminal domain
VSVTIQLRNGTAAQWATANPVLAAGEMGAESDTLRFKFGNGVTAWAGLTYAGQFSLASATDVLFSDIAEPATPAAGTIKLYFRRIAGRMRAFMKEPSGLATMLATDPATNYALRILTNTSTSVTTLGGASTAVGTISHPTPTEQWGVNSNFLSAATANATCGISASVLSFLRGSVVGANGFEFSARLGFPDASYDQTGAATTGTRIFIGLSDQVFATATVNADAPVGNFVGFRRNHVNAAQQHANWQFQSRDGVTTFNVDTGMPFVVGKMYDFRIFCGPQATSIGWHIMNLTDNTEASGTVTNNLPPAATYMRPGWQLLTIQALARNVRQQLLTCESDR